MERDFGLTELFDLYGELLTARQRELFTSYYIYDLSLAEIAQPEGKTRQNVYEQIKKVKAKLLSYEQALGLRQKNGELKKLCARLDEQTAQRILEIIGR